MHVQVIVWQCQDIGLQQWMTSISHKWETILQRPTMVGVQAILGDAERICGWDLITHDSFLTYGHHNACDLCMYIYHRSCTKATHCRPFRFRCWTNHDHRCLYRIQPPGSNHIVYMPQNGLTSGGHFLCYSRIHLVEVTVWYDCGKIPGWAEGDHASIAANSEHPSIQHYICDIDGSWASHPCTRHKLLVQFF